MPWGESHDDQDRKPEVVLVHPLDGLHERLDRIEETQWRILRGLRVIEHEERHEMSEIDDLRAGQAATNEAIQRLGVSAANAATRVLAKLDELVAAEGNQVTEADVADIRDDALALADIAGQIDAIAPADATTPPPAEPPVGEPPVETPPVEEPPVETPPVDEPAPPVDETPVEPAPEPPVA